MHVKSVWLKTADAVIFADMLFVEDVMWSFVFVHFLRSIEDVM